MEEKAQPKRKRADKKEQKPGIELWQKTSAGLDSCAGSVAARGRYVGVVETEQDASTVFEAMRARSSHCRAFFIVNGTALDLAYVLALPSLFENNPSDCLLTHHDPNSTSLSVPPFNVRLDKSRIVEWDGTALMHRLTKICQRCFIEGKLQPEAGCALHVVRQCKHKKFGKACKDCFVNSFGSWWCDRVKCWNLPKNGGVRPWEVGKTSNKKFFFTCESCQHDWETSPHAITSRCEPWCPYCGRQKLCDSSECKICYARSFASYEDSAKIACWHPTKNGTKTPRQVARSSGVKCHFVCSSCQHNFERGPNEITSADKKWCPYCRAHKLCENPDCKWCHERSFAGYKDSVKVACWHPTMNGNLTPRQVSRASTKVQWFLCRVCGHCFDICIGSITVLGNWCRFCRGYVCGLDSCLVCAQVCDICKTKKAATQTQLTRTWCCRTCLETRVKDDHRETPLEHRAKITLEIYFLAELQRLDDTGIWCEPSCWDCAVLPGLNYKPDLLFAFDSRGAMLSTVDGKKLALSAVCYVLVLEVLEESQKVHTVAREISDEQREQEIRHSLRDFRVGFLYVTLAHKAHRYAHPDDVFFMKRSDNGEYELVKTRKEAWNTRVNEVLEKLQEMLLTKSDETHFIGH